MYGHVYTVNLPCKMPVKNYTVFTSYGLPIFPTDPYKYVFYTVFDAIKQVDYSSFDMYYENSNFDTTITFQILYAPYINASWLP